MLSIVKKRGATVGASDSLPSAANSSTPGSVTHRELCVVMLRDTLRLHGIPREWMGLEVIDLSAERTGVRLQINFLVHHWHEGLFKYAPVLQQQFLQALQRFDKTTDHTQHVVCWRFSEKFKSHYNEMPEPSYWSQTPTPRAVPVARPAVPAASAAPATPAPVIQKVSSSAEFNRAIWGDA